MQIIIKITINLTLKVSLIHQFYKQQARQFHDSLQIHGHPVLQVIRVIIEIIIRVIVINIFFI